MTERNYRQKALDHHGDECIACGSPEDVVHHADGDRSNNAISNLVPLCAACHQKVHAGKAENETIVDLVTRLGKEPRCDRTTTVQISEALADKLHERKARGDAYEDVLWELIGFED